MERLAKTGAKGVAKRRTTDRTHFDHQNKTLINNKLENLAVDQRESAPHAPIGHGGVDLWGFFQP
ncbi:hypothetical protein [Hydrogenophilus islandicus]